MKSSQRDNSQSRWRSTFNKMLSIAAVITLAACSSSNKQTNQLKDNSVPNPRPVDTASIESQLKRFVGQTEFMNIDQPYSRFRDGPIFANSRAMKTGAEGQRSVQESDIFKVGKEGSKLLYVLNDYRGLQVISFFKGADAPELVGRLDATGNYPTNMYFDESNDRLIVLERNWYDQESGEYRSSESRLLVYSVKDAANPKIESTLNITGEIADSRLVGDVLYVATSVWPQWNSANYGDKGQGRVVSYKLSEDGVREIASQALTLPVSRRENMNIVEVQSEGSFKYYLVAILSEKGWGWWDRQSAVEVVDISSPDGKIAPVMIASAKGFIEERSATSIKNGTLIVASNYQTEGTGAQSLMRVAVETFKFPTKTSVTISDDEATYRRLHIDREMKRIPAGQEPEVYLNKLINDPELGIGGVFVKSENGSLKKLICDDLVTVGDSTGLHADLQDVRFANDLLYIFWVPANMRDPLDIIDIANPEVGIKHLKRELFEGWIERAFPVEYKGHTYIMGLGWVLPTIGDENPRRVPQAMLFEVERQGTGIHIDTIAQMNMLGANVWVDFNAADKFIETRFNDDGTGAILFKISSWNNGYTSGGKLLGFDLNQAIAGQYDRVFAEGGVLKGSSDWLRRVFTNPEIDRVNTLSNTSLGVFNVNWKNLGAASEVHTAIATLELARNVKAYATVEKNGGTLGIQIISEGNQWSWDAASTTKLRLVNSKKADQELKEVAAEVEIRGRYLSHLVVAENVIVVTTENILTGSEGDENRINQSIYHVTQISVDAKSLKIAGNTSFSETASRPIGRRMWWPSYNTSAKLTKLDSGRVILTTHASVKELAISSTEVSATDISLGTSCSRDGVDWAIESFDGKLFMTYGIAIIHSDAAKADLRFTKSFIAEIQETEAGFSCSLPINIPGKAISNQSGKLIIAEDNRLLDIREHRSEYRDSNGNNVVRTYFEPVTTKVLVSLALSEGPGQLKAALRSMYDLQNSTSKIHALPNNTFVIAEKQGEYSYAQLSTLSLDESFRFTKDTFTLELAQDYATAKIISVVQDPHATNGFLAIVSLGQKAQVLAWNSSNPRPQVRKIRILGTNLEPQEATASFRVLNSWGWDSENTVHFTPASLSFEIPEGLSGLKQVFVELQ